MGKGVKMKCEICKTKEAQVVVEFEDGETQDTCLGCAAHSPKRIRGWKAIPAEVVSAMVEEEDK